MSNIYCDFSVIGFSETWLNSSNIDTYGIDGYNHVGITRESGKGGGVSLFISDDIIYCELSEFNMMCEYIECVFIEMNYKAHKMVVGFFFTDHPTVTLLISTMPYMISWNRLLIARVASWEISI